MTHKLDPKLNSELFVSSQVAQGLAVIGDRWAFLIIRDVYLGISRFKGLRESADCSRGTLTSRLKSLVANEILYKKAYQTSPPRFEYCLTAKGLDLYPVVLMMWRWEHNWGTHHYLPSALIHKSCGKNMVPIYKCKACDKELDAHDTSFSIRKKFDTVTQVAARSQRRTKSESEKNGAMDSEDISVLDCVGDRWTSLVLAAGFFGLQRFDQMASAIRIGTSVLADRLSLLVQTGIMNRIPYQQSPPRYEYHLSNKGRDLFGHTIAIHEWAERWLIRKDKGLLRLRHLPCDQPFAGEVVCSQCDQALYPHEVSYAGTHAATKD
jgi:DNA-binding HxlR family transcriptional regulator